MKRILFLFASIVAFSTTAFASTNTTSEAEASINNYVRGYGNSFIFTEAGIEFSVYADGQFDFYMPNYGPDVSVAINTPGFTLSFNSGYDYNPYVQYDGFGAIIQIENTPIYYDYYGRVNQIGNIFINYNSFGRISRLGGLNVYYRNNVYWRCDGFINVYNTRYIYRPWHRFYAVPTANFCVVNVNPYRQFYTPVRHIYYRPYTNNVRYYNVNGRRGSSVSRAANTRRSSDRYAQSPRNKRERSIKRRVERSNASIAKTRAVRLKDNNVRNTRRSDKAINTRSNTRVSTPSRANSTRKVKTKTTTTRTNTRVTAPNRTQRSNNKVTRTRNSRENVTRTRNSVSNRMKTRKSTSVRKPNTTTTRSNNRARSQSSRQRSTIKNKRKSSSTMTRSNTSRRSNQSSTRSSSRRSRI